MARRTKEDAVATRNGLLDAAEQIFLEQGVSRASLAAIAEQAGATRGAVYWHFKDKLDLFNAMIDRVSLPLDQVLYGNEAGRASDAPLSRICRMMYVLLHGLAHDERLRRVFTIMMHRVEFVGELEALQARHTAAMEECANKLARDMEAAAAQYGVVLRHPPKLLAKGLSSLLDGLMNSWLMGGQSFDLVQDGFAAIEMYLIGAGLPQQAVQEGFREAVACQSTP